MRTAASHPVALYEYSRRVFQLIVLPPYSGEKNEVSSWFVGGVFGFVGPAGGDLCVGPAAVLGVGKPITGGGGADGTGVTVTREVCGVWGRAAAASSSAS